MVNPLSAEVWYLIAEKVAEEDWKPLFSTLPFVCRTARGGAIEYLNAYVLPKLQKIAKVDASLSIVSRCQNLQNALERKHCFLERHWHKPIHMAIKNLLRNGGPENWKRVEDLLEARVEVNSFTSQRSTPLLLVCDALGEIFTARMEPSERSERYEEIIQITKRLLEHGADPNVEGFPSTPLVTILSQQPPSDEEKNLMRKLVDLLVKHGARVEVIPNGDHFGLNKSPAALAKQWGISPPAE